MSRLASAFPPIHELPAMFCAYALTAGIGYVVWPSFLALLRNVGAIA
jgi:hypothetical protein